MNLYLCHQSGDRVMLTGESIEELRGLARQECAKRGWKEEDTWSQEV